MLCMKKIYIDNKKKNNNLCSEDERRSYEFGTTRGSVINDNFHVWVNYLFNSSAVS